MQSMKGTPIREAHNYLAVPLLRLGATIIKNRVWHTFAAVRGHGVRLITDFRKDREGYLIKSNSL